MREKNGTGKRTAREIRDREKISARERREDKKKRAVRSRTISYRSIQNKRNPCRADLL